VWVKLTPRGEPAAGPDGRVEILYKPGGKVYRASVRNLEADPAPERLSDAAALPAAAPVPTDTNAPATEAIHVYTDGACTGNPGPMGIGVVILDGKQRREISEYLGHGTNNIAELTAILRGLEAVPADRPIIVYSDSSYALGLLSKGWKAKANQELVETLRAKAAQFKWLRFVKVAGHSGVPENERCDELARQAIIRRS
jgi:ribonuclease HI